MGHSGHFPHRSDPVLAGSKVSLGGMGGGVQNDISFGDQLDLSSNLSSTISYANFGKLFIFSEPQLPSIIIWVLVGKGGAKITED